MIKLLGQGQSINGKQYLETALSELQSSNLKQSQKNKTRELIKEFFSQRDCQLLIRPVENEQQFQQLDKDIKCIRPQFLIQMEQTKELIFNSIQPKTMNGVKFNSRIFIDFAEHCINRINSKELPSLEDSWQRIKELEIDNIINETMQQVTEKINKLSNNQKVSNFVDYKKEKMIMITTTLSLLLKKEPEISQENLSKIINSIKLQFSKLKNDLIVKQWCFQKKLSESEISKSLPLLQSKMQKQSYQNIEEFFSEIKPIIDDIQKQFQKLFYDYPLLQKISMQEFMQKLYQEFLKQLQNNNTIKINENEEDLQQKIDELELELEEKVQQFKSQNEENIQLNKKIEELNQIQQNLEINIKQLQNENQSKDQIIKEQEFKLQELSLKIKENEQLQQQQQNQTTILCQEQIQQITKQSNETQLKFQKELDEKDEIIKKLQNEEQKIQKELYQKQECIFQQEQSFKLTQNNIQSFKEENIALKKLIQDLQQENSETQQQLVSLEEFLNKELQKQKQKQAQKWQIERCFLESQISLLTDQLESNKKLHDALILALQKGLQQKENSQNAFEMEQNNKKLIFELSQIQSSYRTILQEQNNLQEFKQLVESTNQFRCKICSSIFNNLSTFKSHVTECNEKSYSNSQLRENSFISHQSTSTNYISQKSHNKPQTPGSIHKQKKSGIYETKYDMISQQLKILHFSFNHSTTQFVIKYQFDKIMKEISKSIQDFYELHISLEQQLPTFIFPLSASIFQNNMDTIDISEDVYRIILLSYLQDIIQIDEIKCTKQFMHFFELSNFKENLQLNQPFVKKTLKQKQLNNFTNNASQYSVTNRQSQKAIRNKLAYSFVDHTQLPIYGNSSNSFIESSEFIPEQQAKLTKPLISNSFNSKFFKLANNSINESQDSHKEQFPQSISNILSIQSNQINVQYTANQNYHSIF